MVLLWLEVFFLILGFSLGLYFIIVPPYLSMLEHYMRHHPGKKLSLREICRSCRTCEMTDIEICQDNNDDLNRFYKRLGIRL